MAKKKTAKKKTGKKKAAGQAKKEKIKTITGVPKRLLDTVIARMWKAGAISVNAWLEPGKKTYTVRAVFPG